MKIHKIEPKSIFLKKELFKKKQAIDSEELEIQALRKKIDKNQYAARTLKNTHKELHTSLLRIPDTTELLSRVAWHHKAFQLALSCEEQTIEMLKTHALRESSKNDLQKSYDKLQQEALNIKTTHQNRIKNAVDLLEELDLNEMKECMYEC